MTGLTKYVLKRPLTAIMAVLCLVVFGFSSVMNTKTEITPEMNMPMLIIRTVYSGANPEDVDELVSKKIEDAVGALSGVKNVTSTSSESMSMVMVQYDYGQDIDEAYDDLKKKVDAAVSELPAGANEPVIIEMDSSSQADITLSVSNEARDNQYSYVNNEIVPELEKISNVAEVSIAGGSEDYVKIEIIPDAMAQYHLSLQSISADIAAASVTMPGGSVEMGRKELSLSTRLDFETEETLKNIPLTAAGQNVVYLGDVANIYTTYDEEGSIAHYDGHDTVSVMLTKQQSSTAAELSAAVTDVVESLTASDPDLEIVIVNDSADDVRDSIMSVAETLVLAVIISMIVIWLFFGDLKASAIVGSSIPFSILAALILMKCMDFSLNLITMAALTMGVGMMVDNSIVVLESCFRVSEEKDKGLLGYTQAALEGTGIVGMSVFGSTLTTCVVFLPLAFLGGMAGQMFKPLGFTICFCMAASLISAITIVPLCYMLYRPKEKRKAPFSHPINRLQQEYRRVMKRILPKRKTVMVLCVLFLVFSFLLASKLGIQLISSDDQGQVLITVQMQPGLKTAEQARILNTVEEQIAGYEELESYITSMGENDSEASVVAYLMAGRKTKTRDVVKLWDRQLSETPDCNITVEENTQTASMNMDMDSYELILQGTDYEELKSASSEIVKELMKREELTRVHSTLENSAPVLAVSVDAVKAKAAGISPATIGASVYEATNGAVPTTLTVNGNDVDVKVRYPKEIYRTVDQIKTMVLTLPGGSYISLNAVADVHFEDSPASISRKNKQYQVTITGDYAETAGQTDVSVLNREAVLPHMTSGVSMGSSMAAEMQGDELSSLVSAVMTAIFLIFVVLVSQFESIRYAVMVMLTIPFSLIGSFGLMYLTGCDLGMVSILGFLMLVGTVVNAGILYVDTVSQYRLTMDLDTALIEAGATRLRPILMTTLTTIVSMVPMALALGNSGQMIQGLAIVNIGGLTASTLLSLLMLPVYYSIMSKKKSGAQP
ncbi:efflux RND transporter permease subunit [Clostridium transplantifaecale]|uniref:efflux RND transporter permease subunit n=1 Tax=Clostridium transplantifaecale TaxID=2479838 RepID=UPI000F63EAB6|nr:efflux RND transporter permease subunit [Clostridium transplantifaecale]